MTMRDVAQFVDQLLEDSWLTPWPVFGKDLTKLTCRDLDPTYDAAPRDSAAIKIFGDGGRPVRCKYTGTDSGNFNYAVLVRDVDDSYFIARVAVRQAAVLTEVDEPRFFDDRQTADEEFAILCGVRADVKAAARRRLGQ